MSRSVCALARIIPALLAAILSLLGLVCHAEAQACPASTAGFAAFAYDGDTHAAATTRSATERGPPTTSVRNATYDAVSSGLHGALARPEWVASSATITYATSVTPVPARPPTTTTGRRVLPDSGEFSSLAPAGVAANGVASTSRYTRTSFGGNRVYQRNDLIDPAAVDKLGRTNLERMQSGIAPLGRDGRWINLHHLTQRPNGAIAEVTATMHQTNSRVLHINPSTIPSGIDRGAFDAWRRSYWISRAGDF